MKFSLSWLKDYLDTDASLDVILEKLTDIGLEVEGVEDRSALYAPFKVVEVLEAVPHPNADRLRVCQVKTESGVIQVVCGAPYCIFLFLRRLCALGRLDRNVGIQIRAKEFSVEYKMTDDIQLADLLEAYLPTTDPDFQQKITDKYEFSSLASSVSERPPKAPKRYYKHQELTHRFLRQYDDLCVLSETGTGKTTEVLGFTEMVRDQVLLAAIHPEQAHEKLSHFRQVIVLVKGENQANELNSQLVCKISQGRYLTEQVLKAPDESSQKRAVKSAVKKWYHFTTYQKFVNNIPTPDSATGLE